MTRVTVRSRHQIVRSTAGILVMAIFCLTGATACLPEGHTQHSLDLANAERSARGIPDLSWDDESATKAQGWAEHMAAQFAISHSSLQAGITGNWTVLGENVGVGPDTDAVHNGFMNSPKHRAAILSGRYRSMGVGIASRNGYIFVVQEFRG